MEEEWEIITNAFGEVINCYPKKQEAKKPGRKKQAQESEQTESPDAPQDEQTETVE